MTDSTPRRRRETMVLGISALLLAAWFAGSGWLVPAIIRRAHSAENLGFLSDLMSARATTPVEEYLSMWAGFAGVISTVLLAAGGLILFFSVLSLVLEAETRRLTGRADEGAPTARAPAVLHALRYAAWFGALTGFAEALYLTKKYLFREWIPAKLAVSQDFLWMIPLAYAATFFVLMLPVSLAGRKWPGTKHPAVGAFLLSFLGFLSLFQATAERLELYAAAILAIGLATQMGRMARARPEAFASVVRRGAVWLLAIWILVAAAVPTGQWIRERRAGAGSIVGEGAAGGPPNVLLIILDTVRAKNLSLHGYARPTSPELSRFGETGVVFERAMATSPWTLPTHASVFTGRPHHELSTDWKQPLDDAHPTLAEYLAGRGYTTAGFLGNFYYAGDAFGLARGFARYEDQPRSLGMIVHSAWLTRSLAERARRQLGIHQDLVRKTADDINRAFLGWLDRRDDRPFFAFLNYFDAHDPYLPPEPFNTRFSDEQPLYWLASDDATKLDDSDIAELEDAYDASIAYLDHRLGVLFDELEVRGTLDNTLLIITSDHGEEFGEHGLMFHGHTLYLHSVHVPLIVSFPGRVPAGVRVREPVSLTDIPATINELIGAGAESPFPGMSLLGRLGAASAGQVADAGGARAANSTGAQAADSTEAQVADSPPVLVEVTANPRTPRSYPVHKGNMYALLHGSYRYIRNGDGTEELYDVDADPDEQVDLAGTEAGEAALGELRARLDAILGLSMDGGRSPRGSPDR